MIPVILALLLNSALLTGNEFALAAFIHPSLSRQDHRSNLSAIQRFAHLYGGVMPIWMAVLLSIRVSLAMCCCPNLGYCDSLQPHLSSSFE
jgi:hypothetical protein